MITDKAVRKKGVPPVPAVALNGRFKRYEPEKERPIRKADIRMSEGLRQILGAWEAFGAKTRYAGDVAVVTQEYGWIDHDALKRIGYAREDVMAFSLGLSEFQEMAHFADKAGAFLSALINNGKDSDYVVHTLHLAIQPAYLGYKNTKNLLVRSAPGVDCGLDFCGMDMSGGLIVVEGTAGKCVGQGMSGGTIIVNGNAGHTPGMNMSGGDITVKGDSETGVGNGMLGGSITIAGNDQTRFIDFETGSHMLGGEIRIGGKIDKIGNVIHGKIYHKGNLIIDR